MFKGFWSLKSSLAERRCFYRKCVFRVSESSIFKVRGFEKHLKNVSKFPYNAEMHCGTTFSMFFYDLGEVWAPFWLHFDVRKPSKIMKKSVKISEMFPKCFRMHFCAPQGGGPRPHIHGEATRKVRGSTGTLYF